MQKLARPPAIAAFSELKPGRYPGKSGLELHLDVVAQLLTEWPVEPGHVQGLLAAPAGMASDSGADLFIHGAFCDALGVRPFFAETVNAGGATYAIMHCRRCGLFQHYPRPWCTGCFGRDPEWVEACGQGEVVTYTVVHQAPFRPTPRSRTSWRSCACAKGPR
ncbi:MAG: hypothetical protein IRY95_01605 [Clostridia bacterium]|nr:hypothetical protein [Clostridia bacterium]